jgi:L-threonylcarbamoyladenylate synthase
MSKGNFSSDLEAELQEAVDMLNKGFLVVIPTETVYGLAANAFNEEAVNKIYSTKGRPSNNPLIVHLKSSGDLELVAKDIPKTAYLLASHFWPGPLTLILPKTKSISDAVTAGYDTVAVRVPNHPMTLSLLERLNFPLVAPSANRTNHISPTKPEHVMNSLGNHCPMILNGGACQRGLESTIVGFEGERAILYRQGAISQDELEAFLGYPMENRAFVEQQIHSPGSSRKHYAPKTPLLLLDKIDHRFEGVYNRIAYMTLRPSFISIEPHRSFALSETGNLEEAAARLFDMLYFLDEEGFDCIVVERMPEKGLGKSINDRLRRAAEK